MKIEKSLYSWQGGKFYEAKKIIPLMPIHERYVETFGGSFVLLYNKPRSKHEFGNDKFSCLVSFWKTIQRPRLVRRLMRRIKNTLDSQYMYQEYMRQKPEELDMLDRAYRFMYLDYFGFNSYFDTYYTPLTHKIGSIRDHIGSFFRTGKKLFEYHDRIKKVHFTNYDFKECIDKQKPDKRAFIFLDPPYINTHGYNRGYNQNLSFPVERYEDMRDSLLAQHEGGTRFMITCNQENTYFDEMPDIVIKLIERRSCINANKKRKPVKTKIIMNYDVKDVGSAIEMYEERKNQGGFMML